MNSAVVFLLLSATLFAVTSAGEPGYISVYHNGGYVAYLVVEYKENGSSKTIETENFNLGVTKTVKIPEGATSISITAKAYVFFGVTTDIFTETFSSPVKRCYKIWGFTVSPNYAKIDC